MLREIIKPQSEEYILHIPKEYLNHEVEILVLPFTYPKTVEEKQSKKEIFAKTAGILASQNIDPLAWQEED